MSCVGASEGPAPNLRGGWFGKTLWRPVVEPTCYILSPVYGCRARCVDDRTCSHAMNARALRSPLATLALLAMTDMLAAQASTLPPNQPSTATATALATSPPWQQVTSWLDGEVARFSQSLAAAHATLLRRAKDGADQSSIEKLQPTPPKPRARGYGLLPPIRPDLPVKSAPISSRRYSLEDVSFNYARDLRDAALLASRAAAGELERQVADYLWLKSRHDSLQGQVAYHRQWQDAVPKYEAYFQGRNRIAAKVDRMQKLRTDPMKAAEAQALHDEIKAELAPFLPNKALRLVVEADGTRRLDVEIVTDVADDDFLTHMREAIVREWSECAASKRANLRVDVRWRRMMADDWRAPPPPSGDMIEQDAHLARFPADAVVLTTGAPSTGAMMNRAILLGTDPIRPRELAHEFGHLIGFQDAYLRTYEGNAKDPFGLCIIEWNGLVDDLMGDSVCGVVDDGMVARLLAAYGDAK